MTTYCKLRSGEWGIKGEGLEEGKVVQVGKVIFTKDAFSIAAISKPSAPKEEELKNCWECGCKFSKDDCFRRDGDWNEGYCGC
jgi:hypothetical protein